MFTKLAYIWLDINFGRDTCGSNKGIAPTMIYYSDTNTTADRTVAADELPIKICSPLLKQNKVEARHMIRWKHFQLPLL